MVNKHMKSCCTSGCQKNANENDEILLHPCHNSQSLEHWTGTLIYCSWECKTVQPLWKSGWWFVTKLHIIYHTIYCSAPWYLPKELKAYLHTKTCAWVFMATFLIITKTWKPPRCPSVCKWINCDISRQWSSTPHRKEMNHHTMKRQGRNLTVYY